MYIVGDWVEGNVSNLSFGDCDIGFVMTTITKQVTLQKIDILIKGYGEVFNKIKLE